MFTIPFTKGKLKVTVNFWTILLVGIWIWLSVTAGWKGFVGLPLFFFGLWGLTILLWWATLFFADGQHRRPGESWFAFSKRQRRRLAVSSARRAQQKFPLEMYRYISLDCGHVLFSSADPPPSVGEQYWCPGHRRFGPAQQQVVTAVEEWPHRVPKTIMDHT